MRTWAWWIRGRQGRNGNMGKSVKDLMGMRYGLVREMMVRGCRKWLTWV